MARKKKHHTDEQQQASGTDPMLDVAANLPPLDGAKESDPQDLGPVQDLGEITDGVAEAPKQVEAPPTKVGKSAKAKKLKQKGKAKPPTRYSRFGG